eukprot:PITA_14179
MMSSLSTYLGSPLVQSSHGTSADTGTGVDTGSLRTGDGTGTQGSVGKPSSSPDWGAKDEVPYGEYSSGKRRPKWLQDTLKEAESVSPPKRVNRESVPPERFYIYVAKATSIVDLSLIAMRRLPARRWLYKIKNAVDGIIKKFKVRFVAKGFSQIEGVDYDKTFAPVSRYTSIQSLISIVAEMGWQIH